MPEVLPGSQSGATLSEIQLIMADDLGYSVDNTEFKNMVARWTNRIIRDVQLADPKLRRTLVHDAPWSIQAGVAEYDVRKPVVDGGFGWDNCFEVLNLVIPEISARPLEPLSVQQWRNRSDILSNEGPGYSWVLLDQFRVRIAPTPDKPYSGKGDYLQDIPNVSQPTHRVDWPKAWDEVILAGVQWLGNMWQHKNQPSVWIPLRSDYQERIVRLKMHERTTERRPSTAVASRNLRSRRFIPHDNSADWRWRGW